MDYVALGIILGLIVFSLVMFIIIRNQSRKSEHPEAQITNHADPTPLYHAPVGSQADFSRSMVSLALMKGGSESGSTSRLGTPDLSKNDGSSGKLFFEDTGRSMHGGRKAEA